MLLKLKILYHEFLGIVITFTGNRKKSSKHFLEAAELGSPRSQNIVAAYYHEGRGVDKDDEKAFQWYKKSAKQNYIYGLANMGWAFYHGVGVSQDYKEAIVWYQKSAEKDHAESQYVLGYIFAEGLGVKKDIQQAIAWLKKAEQNKYKKAAEFLKEINTQPNA